MFRFKQYLKMNWNKIITIEDLENVKNESNTIPILIFKHSTRCSISSTALDRFERAWAKNLENKNVKPYYLDLIANRDISNAISKQFSVQHESPQLLLIKNGESIYDESHYGISLDDVLEKIQ